MVHKIEIETESEFYLFWQEQKTAIIVPTPIDENYYKQWDTIILTVDKPKWSLLPIYYKISYIEQIKNGVLLHLRK